MTNPFFSRFIRFFLHHLPLTAVIGFILINLLFNFPNPYNIPPEFGWLSNPNAQTTGGHCSISIQK